MVFKRHNGYVKVMPSEQSERIQAGQCPVCGLPKSEWKRRKDWTCCCQEHTQQFEGMVLIRSWPQMRLKAFERDCFQCQYCKKVPVRVEKMREGYDENFYRENYSYTFLYVREGMVALAADDLLIADHMVPIAVGGDQWDLGNVQTLCVECNKRKTAKDSTMIAVLRKREKHASVGQRRLSDD